MRGCFTRLPERDELLVVSSKKESNGLLLLAILLLGLALRVIGLDFGRPFRYHPDEVKLVLQAGNLLNFHNWSVDTFFAIRVYPPFFTYVLALVSGIYSALLMLAHGATDFTLVRQWYYQNPFQFHMLARWISVISGTASIYLLYRIGKRLYNEKSGLLAAFFLAVSFIHVRNSHFGVVDILMTFLMLASFLAAVGILQTGKLRYYLWASVFAGLATATKWNAFLVVLATLTAHLLACTESGRVDWHRLFGRPFWVLLAVWLAAFLVACPMPLLDFKEFLGGVIGGARFQKSATIKMGAGGGFFSYFTGNQSPGYGFFYDNAFYLAMGWGAVLTFLLGIVVLLARRRRSDWLLLVLPIVWYALMGVMSYKAMRQILPVVPYLLLIAAETLCFLIARIRNARKQLVFAVVWIAAIVLPTGIKALRYGVALTQTDTRSQMKRWIEENLPADSRIGLEEFGPPLLSRWDLNLHFLQQSPHYKKVYQVYGLVPGMFAHGKKRSTSHDPSDDVVRWDVDYVVLDSFTYERYHWPQTVRQHPETVAQRDDFYRWIAAHAALLHRVEPENGYHISPSLELYQIHRLETHAPLSDKLD